MMRRRAEITIETDRVLLVNRKRRGRAETRCAACGEGARVIALEDAAALLRVHPQTMLGIAGSAGLHLTQTTEGTTLICLSPLRRNRPQSVPVKLNHSALKVQRFEQD